MSHHLAILAYGSLIANPGAELEQAIESRRPVQTPFAVEYARCSRSRCGAPTLVKVDGPGIGAPVRAQLLILRDGVTIETARDMLYRREIHRVGKLSQRYDAAQAQHTPNTIQIEELSDVAGVEVVLYAGLCANLDFILDPTCSPMEKAGRLAQLAVESVTLETFEAGTDGIRYLADAIRSGIQTPLTEPYREAVLRLADNAPDLEEARLRTARRKGIVAEESSDG